MRFSERLRRQAEPHWSRTVRHGFTDAIADGSIPGDAFARYLVQDYVFVDALVGLVAAAVHRAPDMDTRRPLARFLAVLTGGENDYFQQSFDALGVSARGRTSPRLLPVTQRFRAHLERAAERHCFEEILAVLLPVEWCYLAWATRVSASLRRRRKTLPRAHHLRDWIALHNNSDFAAFVGWMRREIDRRGPALPPVRQRAVGRLFARTMALESAFFDAFHAPRLDARAPKV